MDTITASNRMLSLIVLFDMHSTYFRKAIDGISDEDAHNRLHTKANHMAWLTGSLVQERFEVAKELGIDKKQSADELFRDHKGIQEGTRYPSLETFKKDWDFITPPLREKLVQVTDERLDKLFEMPGEKMSLYDYLSFLIYREANCIGQLALWRRLMDYPPINYMSS